MSNKEFVLKLIKYFCFSLLLFAVFIISFACGFYYRDSGHSLDLDTQSISLSPADTVNTDYYFTSSNIIVPVSAYSNVDSQTVYWNGYCSFQLNIPNNIDELCSINFSFINFYNESIYNYEKLYYFDITGSWELFITDIDDSPASYIACSYRREVGFLPHIVSVTVSNVTTAWGNKAYSTELCYYDINGKTLRIQVMRSRTSDLISLSTRSYYFVDNFSSDNDYYQAGYDYGYGQGLSNGQPDVYQNGYSAGYRNGDLVGYQRGIEDSNQYTFLNLIGAVIDAPISAFVNLLDFNVFGFNMLNLCCSLLTLSLIILVVKFVLFRS